MEMEKKVVFLNLGTPEGVVRSIDYLEGHEILTESTGRHLVCDAEVDFYPLSETYNIMLCRKCGLRIPYPIGIMTWQELKNWYDESSDKSSSSSQEGEAG